MLLSIPELEELYHTAFINRQKVPSLTTDTEKIIYDYDIDLITNDNSIKIERNTINSDISSLVLSYLSYDDIMFIITSQKIADKLLQGDNYVYMSSNNSEMDVKYQGAYLCGKFSNIHIFKSYSSLLDDAMLIGNVKNGQWLISDISNSLVIKITDTHKVYI